MTKDALSFLRSSFEETEALVNTGAKIQHPVSRGLAPNQEPHLQVPEKSSQKELEAMALGTASDAIEIREAAHPTDVSISKTALYSRIGTAEVETPAGLLFQQPNLDATLQMARAEVLCSVCASEKASSSHLGKSSGFCPM